MDRPKTDSGGGPAGRHKLRILAIGFMPPPLGGVSISFKIFHDIVTKRCDIDLRVINVSGMRQRKRLLRESASLVARIWRDAPLNDVVTLYCTPDQIPSLGLATWAVCRLRGKPLILRMAAGQDYRELGTVSGRIAEFVIRRVELFLVQTNRLVELCRLRRIQHVAWYPTSRPAAAILEDRTLCRRFVFIGQVRPLKGLYELISAAEEMPESVEVDVYGPLLDGMDETDFCGCKRISYKGVLDPQNVASTMKEYDAFVLPSKASTEGYPGAILEALSMGMPVIATTVGGIPEIVDEKCGILVDPDDKKDLADAMRRLNVDAQLYRDLRCGARAVRSRFSAQYWAEWLVDECARLSQRK